MYIKKGASLILINFLLVACTSNQPQLAATIDAQNTRLAEIEVELGSPTPLSPTATAAVEPTAVGIATQEPDLLLPTDSRITPEFEEPSPAEPVAQEPSLLWSLEAESHAYNEDMVFIQTPQNTVHALDMSSGTTIWSLDTGGEVIAAGAGNVYVSPVSQRIDTYDTRTGEF